MPKPNRNYLDPGGQMIMIEFMGANDLTGSDCCALIDGPDRALDEYCRCDRFV